MFNRKPNCSYNCLIGMALRSSESGRLPVGEIYRFFEKEFPYFLTAAEPWKNSLRHSLSLGHYFRKYNSDKLVTKKGHLWEVDPLKTSELDKEMYMFLVKGIPDNLPSSSRLSKLRLQMTQLLLDSIKNTPSSSLNSSLTSPRKPSPSKVTALGYPQYHGKSSKALLLKSIQRPVADVVILTPEGAAYSESVKPKKATCIYSGPSTSALPSVIQSSQGGLTRQVLLSSTPPKSLLLPHQQLPRGPRRPLQVNAEQHRTLFGDHHNETEKRKGTDIAAQPVVSNVSDKALQLVQFCNHCTFEIGTVQGVSKCNNQEGSVNGSPNPQLHEALPAMREKQIENSLSRQNPGSQLVGLSRSYPCTFQDAEEAIYPFIAPPNACNNVTLSQLNGNLYNPQPGPPKELMVTKCVLPKRTDLCRSCRSLDKAVQPVLYNWNSWWEAEHVHCVMNEESYMNCVECRCEEDIKDLLGKESRSNRNNSGELVTPRKNEADPSFPSPNKFRKHTTMITSASTSHAEQNPIQTTKDTPEAQKCESRGFSPLWLSKLKSPKSRSSPSDTKDSNQWNIKVKSQHGDIFTKIKVVDAYKSLKLIVSIPFRRLVTERQLKKYCGEGGKHRILTQ